MGYLYLVICLAALFGGIGIWFVYLRKYGKDKKRNAFTSKELKTMLLGWILIGVGGLFIPASTSELSAWGMAPGKMAMAAFSGYFFTSAFAFLWACFYIRFYRADTTKKQLRAFKIGLYVSIPIALLAALLYLESVSEYLTYPLCSGFSINGTGFHLFNAQNENSGDNAGGLRIAWYGVIIVFGALVAYWISDHRMYKKYGRHGILESTLLVAFPAGIIGARIWYVVGNWEKDGFNTNFGKVFEIWNGGLTILGGAVAGILVGALWVIFRRKYVDLRYAIDFVIPTILLAQAIGRWGNFFNLEVYGNVVNINDGWNWVPTWIQNQMQFFARAKDIPATLDPSLYSGLQLIPGYMNAPFFLIESLLNIAGFFIISYLVPVLWRKHRAPGVNLGLYLLWYGVVRIVMEPLRNSNFQMGNDNLWSVINAGIYIGLGVLAIAGFEIFYFYRMKKGLPMEIVRGKMPKTQKPKPKKSTLQIVAEAQMQQTSQQENEQKPVENPENPAETPQEETLHGE